MKLNKLLLFAGFAVTYCLTPPPINVHAWTEDLMQARCATFVGNPANDSNKVYVATVNGEKTTYLKMKYSDNCSGQGGVGGDAIADGYNNFTRNKFGTMILHRPPSDKYSVFYGNQGKIATDFFVKLNTTACAHGKKGYWCDSSFYTDGGHAGGKEYLYAGVSNVGVPIMNSYYPVDNPCTQAEGKNACYPKGYEWRTTAWDSGNISKSDYDSASSGTAKYKVKYSTVERFISQESLPNGGVSYYFNRFSLKNDGEMEAGVLYGSSAGNNYNIVVAAAPKTATRNVIVKSVAVVGNPSYVKGGATITVAVTIANHGDLAIDREHHVKVSYGNTSATNFWKGSLGAGDERTINVSIKVPSSSQTLTLTGALNTNYTSYNQWSSDDKGTTSVKIDATAPTNSVTLSRDNAWGNTNVTATLYTGDTGGSGLNSSQYAMWNNDNNAVVTNWTNYSNGQQITVSREGTTRIQTWSKDNVGNETYGTSKYIKIDKTKPTGSISGSTNWQKGNVTVTLAAGDALSGVKSAQYQLTGATSKCWTNYSNGNTITISNQGATKIEIWVQDHAGNVYTTSKTISLDKTAPTNSVTLSRDNAWGNTNVTATLYTADSGGSGLNSSQYAMWDNSNNAVVTNWTNYSNGQQITVSREGVTRIQTWSKDNAGNETYGTSKYIKIDKTNPTGSISVNTEDWQNVNSVTATLYASDALSGVKSAQYKLSGATTKDWTEYSNNGTITISNEGTTKIEIWVQDHAGNAVYAATKYVKIDRSNPTGSISFNHENWQNASSITATLAAGDGVSGVKTAQYKLSGATTKDWTNYSNGNTITVSNQGATKIEIKVTDNVGRSMTTSKTVRLDRTAPTLSTSQNPVSFTNADEVVVTVKATDNLALWSVNAYETAINRQNLYSEQSGRNTGKVLFVMHDYAYVKDSLDYQGYLNNFKSILNKYGISVSQMKETELTSASQANGYDAVFYFGWAWGISDQAAQVLNTCYNNGISIFSNGNDNTSILHIINSHSYKDGVYTVSKNSNNHLGEMIDGVSVTDGYQAITPISGAKVLANVRHSDGSSSPYLIHHTNSKSAQWIHSQGTYEGSHIWFMNSVAQILMQKKSNLSTSLTHTFTVTENGSFPITAYDLAGNRTTITHVINTIDRHNPTGSVVIDKGQDFLNNEETTIHINFNDVVSGNNVASGIHTIKVSDVNGTYSKTFTNPSGTSMSIPWVLVPWEASDGSLKAQVKVEITDKAGNTITVQSQVVDIIKVYVTDFYLTDVLNPLVYNDENPFRTLTYPHIPSQELMAGGNFSFEFDYYHPGNVNSKWKIDYILNIRYQKPNQSEEVLTTKRLKEQVQGHFETQHIIPYYMPEGTKVYLDIELILYDQNGRKVATGYFPQPTNTSLLIGEIKGDLRDVLQFNEFN